MIAISHVDSGYQIHDLSKNNKFSYTVSHLSMTPMLFHVFYRLNMTFCNIRIDNFRKRYFLQFRTHQLFWGQRPLQDRQILLFYNSYLKVGKVENWAILKFCSNKIWCRQKSYKWTNYTAVKFSDLENWNNKLVTMTIIAPGNYKNTDRRQSILHSGEYRLGSHVQLVIEVWCSGRYFWVFNINSLSYHVVC